MLAYINESNFLRREENTCIIYYVISRDGCLWCRVLLLWNLMKAFEMANHSKRLTLSSILLRIDKSCKKSFLFSYFTGAILSFSFEWSLSRGLWVYTYFLKNSCMKSCSFIFSASSSLVKASFNESQKKTRISKRSLMVMIPM